MDPVTAAALVGALVVAAVIVGLAARTVTGRRRRPGTPTVSAGEIGVAPLGRTATIVQFSTEYCNRCPAVRRSLSELAARHDDVVFADVDLTHRVDLSKRFEILQTPTILVLDGAGAVSARFAGAVTDRPIDVEIDTIRRAADVPV